MEPLINPSQSKHVKKYIVRSPNKDEMQPSWSSSQRFSVHPLLTDEGEVVEAPQQGASGIRMLDSLPEWLPVADQ